MTVRSSPDHTTTPGHIRAALKRRWLSIREAPLAGWQAWGALPPCPGWPMAIAPAAMGKILV
eukprot:COSAG02_NODE_15216_length_1193_cov_1.364717_1_plen_61_part_10